MNGVFRKLASTFILCLVPAILTANTLVIEKVHSGDFIECKGGFKAHLLGVNTPDPDEPLGKEALEFTRVELEGKRIAAFTFTTDNTAAGIVRDEDGFAFMQIGCGKNYSVDFNGLLISKGLGRVDDRLSFPELEQYRKLEEEAKRKGLGIWREIAR